MTLSGSVSALRTELHCGHSHEDWEAWSPRRRVEQTWPGRWSPGSHTSPSAAAAVRAEGAAEEGPPQRRFGYGLETDLT